MSMRQKVDLFVTARSVSSFSYRQLCCTVYMLEVYTHVKLASNMHNIALAQQCLSADCIRHCIQALYQAMQINAPLGTRF